MRHAPIARRPEPPRRYEPLSLHHDPVSPVGQSAHGLYLGARYVHHYGVGATIRAVRQARMTAVVLDLKDGEGRVHHDTAIPALRRRRTGWLGNARTLIQRLHERDIYVIARVVCFADRQLPRELPDRAIHDSREGRNIWVSWGTGGTWLDPYNEENHRMVVDLAREAQELGFDEVQLDYVRFPVDDGTQFAVYPSETSEDRPSVLLRLLREVDEAISIPLGVDVFGLAAYRRGDPSRLGQDLERWKEHVEVFTPMLYINSMREWRTNQPNRSFSLVYTGTRFLRRRIGPHPVIRPYLQAFRRGAGTDLDQRFIRQQVHGARQARADGFLFWHPGFEYAIVRLAMRHGLESMVPFPIPDNVLQERQRTPAPPPRMDDEREEPREESGPEPVGLTD